MRPLLLSAFLLVGFFSQSSLAIGLIRFDPEQVLFYLQDNEGSRVSCEHKLLEHVPWWNVVCGNRSYTVNTWAQVAHNKPSDLTKVTLMYDLSEGVASSGEKLVQFKSHFTNIYVESLTHLRALTSDIDVRNGQASLVMEVTFK